MADNDSDSDQELFSVVLQNIFGNYVYDDPLLVSGVLRAVVENNLEKVKTLISEGKSVNINDNHGNTPLHVAVINNLTPIVNYLLSLEDVAVNIRNFYGETPLYHAVKRGYIDSVRSLIKANGNLNLPNFEDVTPLHLAVKYPEIALELLENGAKTNAIDYSGETPLHEAVSEQNIESVYMLLYYNADANVECDNGITPFMKAIILENVEIQQILLDYVVDFNTATGDGMTILNLALTHTCPFVKDLVERGADVNYKHNTLNPFVMCLQVPDVNKFKLLWKHLEYQPLNADMSFLEVLIYYLEKDQIYAYLNVIIDSDNFTPLLERFTFNPFYNFLKTRVHNVAFWLDITTKLLCSYLCEGYALDSLVLEQIHDLYGYNQLFYICLHMDIIISSSLLSIAHIMYNTILTTGDFKREIIKLAKEQRALSLKQYLPYFKYPEILNVCTPEESNSYYCVLGEFPSLLELARNRARDHLVGFYNLCSSKRYHLFLRDLQMSTVYKDILTFKKPIYHV